MLVYGDRVQHANPREKLWELDGASAALGVLQPGLDRHAKLVALLVDAGRVLQGIADADFAIAGEDRRTPAIDALTAYLVHLAAEVVRSSDEKFASKLRLPHPPDLLDLPDQVELREPEGYSFYAAYPEAYARAARSLCPASPCIIGMRSIGTSLGATVAAALGAGAFVTVRPFGDPFARRISISGDLERKLLDGAYNYVIVDEGPGQSGSSFGAIADWLLDRGVPPGRIAFITSHCGDPGAAVSGHHKRIWAEVCRSVAVFDSSWLSDRHGPLEPLRQGASLKFLGRLGGKTAMLKFVGLGAAGERKFELAKLLHAAGWTAEPLALTHGFIAERWHADGAPLARDSRPLHEIAAYIGTRAQLFPAREDEGASVDELLTMIRRNVGLALGCEAWAALEPWDARLAFLAGRIARVRTDNRMDACKWLRLSDGRLLKTDALDHHCAHDLVGAQDVAWDVAAAAIEFDLDARESAWLVAESGRAAGRSIDPELLDFMTLAYLAFRVGQCELAGIAANAPGYRRRLREFFLGNSPSSIRANPPLLAVRNGPVREQSNRNRVEEEEAFPSTNIYY